MTKVPPYQICKKLVLDTSDPEIEFDEGGVCRQFHDFQANVMPNWFPDQEGERRLREIMSKMKEDGKGKQFDCIVGMSGGADSSYMLHRMVSDYGIRPLVFHVDAGWNTEISVHNINCMIDKLGLDLYTEVIDWEEVRNFQLAMFKSGLPNIDSPQDIAFIGVLFQFANRFNIKYILNGGNIATECVNYPIQYYYYADMALVNDVLRRFGQIKMETYPFTSAFLRKIYMPFVKGIQMIKPLNYMPYVKSEAMAELESTYGWKPYSQKHFESRFTRFFEGYWLPKRFGYDARRVQLSSMILSGQMTRDDALAVLEQPPYDPDMAWQDFEYISKKLRISTEELSGYLEMPKRYFWDYRNQRRFFELGEKLLIRFAKTRRGGAF